MNSPHLSTATEAWLEGGAGDEITVRANEAAWQSLALRPRVLRSLAGSHTHMRLLGRDWPTPLLVAPMAHQRVLHPHGEQATALAAAALGAGLVLSCQASTPLEDVARLHLADPGRGPLMFQLYLQAQREHTETLVRRAEAAGYEALVLTVDAPVQGVRDRELRSGFRLPPGVSAVNLFPSPTNDTATLLARAPTWDDVQWLCELTHLPVWLKGVLHPDDARQAVLSGAHGLIVSNHGGRTLDTTCPTASALPEVIAAVGEALPVLVDGGIRRGTDVLKALGLGATGVLVGRPVLRALAAEGAQGVARALKALHDELIAAQALTGCRHASDARSLGIFFGTRI
jgi:4-hydroxymandelate oxidase